MEIISSQPFSMASFSVNDSQLPAGIVISSAAKRSGEISRLYGTRLRLAGDLWALRFIRAQSLCHPYRRVPPLEMIPPRHFDESEAEWRNLTPKCGKPMVSGDLSALRFNKALSP